MRNIKEINIKNRTYYFFNVMINIKGFNSNFLKTDKKSYKNIGIYNIGYIIIKKIDYYENIYSVNPLYLMICGVIGHIEENNGNKYLAFDSVDMCSMELHSADENKKVIQKCIEICDGIKNKIETITSGNCKYGKDFMKIKFDSDYNLPLNKQSNFPTMTIVVRSVFEDEGKFYLDESLYEL